MRGRASDDGERRPRLRADTRLDGRPPRVAGGGRGEGRGGCVYDLPVERRQLARRARVATAMGIFSRAAVRPRRWRPTTFGSAGRARRARSPGPGTAIAQCRRRHERRAAPMAARARGHRCSASRARHARPADGDEVVRAQHLPMHSGASRFGGSGSTLNGIAYNARASRKAAGALSPADQDADRPEVAATPWLCVRSVVMSALHLTGYRPPHRFACRAGRVAAAARRGEIDGARRRTCARPCARRRAEDPELADWGCRLRLGA